VLDRPEPRPERGFSYLRLFFDLVRIAAHRPIKISLRRAIREVFGVLLTLCFPRDTDGVFEGLSFFVPRVTGAERDIVYVCHAVDVGSGGGNFSCSADAPCIHPACLASSATCSPTASRPLAD
jgi:hypothetical protein